MTRVIYIEDNDDNAFMLGRRLRRYGFEVEVYPDAETGLDAVRRRPPDVVIMDMRLPDMDGWQATRLLKEDAALSGIPVIAVTADALAEDRQRALNAGCDEYESKPVAFDRLVAKIRHLGGAREAELASAC